MRISQFRVQNYRSVKSTGWIDINRITAFIGQNEAGKSNLCEALYRLNPYIDDKYNVDEDWPVDDWGHKNKDGLVCEAIYVLDNETEIKAFLSEVGLFQENPSPPLPDANGVTKGPIMTPPTFPKTIQTRFAN